MGGDTRIKVTDADGMVSIHAPAWGATPASRSRMQTAWFQSTPPHGGRHAVGSGVGIEVEVSIHAPAWGATIGCAIVVAERGVSIHAPAWGATTDTQTQREVD